MQYRYDHFRKEMMTNGSGFSGGPGPGEEFPDFELETIGGETVTREDLHDRPTLVITGSYTCPMTAASSPILKRLYNEFGGKVRFLTVYVREAHPGERFPQPDSEERKVEHARAFASRDSIPWTVAVDFVDGPLHRALGGKPNSAFLIGDDGKVLFRALWANDESVLRPALEAVASGDTPAEGQRANKWIPMLSGVGEMYRTLELAGEQAKQNLRKEAPPLYAMARVAHAFRPMPPVARVAGAVASVALAVVGTGAAALALSRRAFR